MKKIVTGLLAGILLLSIATTALAAGRGQSQGDNYVDRNGDGICDYACGTCNYVDEDKDGVCDYRNTTPVIGNCGQGFVDENEDGVCDNYESPAPQRNGCGRGQGKGRGQGGRGCHGGWRQ